MLLIFDANCSKKLAEGLDLLEQGNQKSEIHAQVRHITKFLKPDATDNEVIQIVGRNKGIIITFDTGFKKIKHRYKLYEEHQIGVILFHSHKDVIYYWDIVKSFVSKWEDLKRKIHEDKVPFLYEISMKGFNKIPLDEKGK
jgi:hypothetical protein